MREGPASAVNADRARGGRGCRQQDHRYLHARHGVKEPFAKLGHLLVGRRFRAGCADNRVRSEPDSDEAHQEQEHENRPRCVHLPAPGVQQRLVHKDRSQSPELPHDHLRDFNAAWAPFNEFCPTNVNRTRSRGAVAYLTEVAAGGSNESPCAVIPMSLRSRHHAPVLPQNDHNPRAICFLRGYRHGLHPPNDRAGHGQCRGRGTAVRVCHHQGRKNSRGGRQSGRADPRPDRSRPR